MNPYASTATSVGRPRASKHLRIAPGQAVFTPSIASEILDLHPRTLMIYESEALVKPQRTATNRRRYSEDDLRRIRAIQFLTREKGVNLAGVKLILSLVENLQEKGLSRHDVPELAGLTSWVPNGSPSPHGGRSA
jgi:MerR family transcriptional regulator/heat shock protein HspR